MCFHHCLTGLQVLTIETGSPGYFAPFLKLRQSIYKTCSSHLDGVLLVVPNLPHPYASPLSSLVPVLPLILQGSGMIYHLSFAQPHLCHNSDTNLMPTYLKHPWLSCDEMTLLQLNTLREHTPHLKDYLIHWINWMQYPKIAERSLGVCARLLI